MKGALPFLLGAAVALLLRPAVADWIDRASPPAAPPPAAAVASTKTIHLFGWTEGDLLVCSCDPGRIEKAATPKRRGP